jgi:NADH-ubiquinone oxidoreductase chain 5
MDTGNITNYALFITLGLITLIFVLFIPVLLENTISDVRLVIIFGLVLISAKVISK